MDIMAINYNEIDNMNNAIDTYKESVNEHIEKIKTYQITGENGFYGAAQIETINGYIDNTATEINDIVRHFDEFKEALAKVQEAYDAKQQSISVSQVEQASEDTEGLITVNKMD